MRSLKSDLGDGSAGLKLSLPDSWPVRSNTVGQLVLEAEDPSCVVEVIRLPWRLVLEPAAAHRAAVERSTRWELEQLWASLPAPKEPAATQQPGFNALTAFERVPLKGGEGVRLVYRRDYRPSGELVVARLLVPLAGGCAELSVSATDTTTGGRESVVYLSAGKQRGPDFFARVDDEALDAKFPAHCLSRARKTLRTLAGRLEVVAPAAPPPARERLELAGVTVAAPPRFGRVPDGVMPSPKGHYTFTRVFHSLRADPQLFEVVALPLQGTLEQQLRAFYASWEKQGVATERLEVAPAPRAGGAEELVTVAFTGRAGSMQVSSHARWLRRGEAALAVTLSRPPWQEPAEADAELDAAVRTLSWDG